MKIHIAMKDLFEILASHDQHVRKEVLDQSIIRGNVIIAEEHGELLGWLRYNLFWDNTSFMNMLYVLEKEQGKGIGKQLVEYWEKLMESKGYHMVMTSTQSNEYAQHFYQKLGYQAVGGFLLRDEPYEIILTRYLK